MKRPGTAFLLLLSCVWLAAIPTAVLAEFDAKYGFRRAEGDSVTDQTLADAACHAKLIRVLVGVCGGCIEPRKIQGLQSLSKCLGQIKTPLCGKLPNLRISLTDIALIIQC